MKISKSPQRTDNFHRPAYAYPSAREAFKGFLAGLEMAPDEVVLLPAYIGWSPREGSGVFDPITELGLTAAFYRIDERLHVDVAHLKEQLTSHRVRLVVLIHYFGYVDPLYQTAVQLAREAGSLILEDEAHAMLTDLIGGGSGRLGDASIFSLHKMLPMATGGMLVHNRPDLPGPAGADQISQLDPWNYDLETIARKRRENAALLTKLLRPLSESIEPLWPDLQTFEIPQTYPVLTRSGSRFDLYTKMNEMGFGVVSLYHTLIKQISKKEFPTSHSLAGTILNLPVHQDVSGDQLETMVGELRQLAENPQCADEKATTSGKAV